MGFKSTSIYLISDLLLVSLKILNLVDMDEKINFTHIISVDYYLSTISIWFLLAILMGITFTFGDGSFIERIPKMLGIIILVSSPGWIRLVLKWQFYHELHLNGIEVNGVITKIHRHAKGLGIFSSGGGSVYFEYAFQNENFTSKNILSEEAFRGKMYETGDEVLLIVNSTNPKKSALKDVFFPIDKIT